MEIIWGKAWGKETVRSICLDVPPGRSYTYFSIADNDVQNEAKFDMARRQLKMLGEGDTLIGVQFHFENNSTYKSFIRALDLCKIEKARMFVPYENDLWVFNYPIRPLTSKEQKCEYKRSYGECGTKKGWMSSDDERIKELVKEEKQERVEKIKNSLWLPALLFLMLVVLSIRKIKRIDREKKMN